MVFQNAYVNICVAAGLILLVIDGLSSQFAYWDEKNENAVWGNPCGSTNELKVTKYSYTPQSKDKLIGYIKPYIRKINDTKEFDQDENYTPLDFTQNEFISTNKISGWMESFTELQEKDFLKKTFIPLNGRIIHKSDIDKSLPYLLKAAKILIAGMVKATEELKISGFPSMDPNGHKEIFHPEIISSFLDDMKFITCILKEIVINRLLPVLPLNDSEVPKLSGTDAQHFIVHLMRDTRIFLEYTKRLFKLKKRVKQDMKHVNF